MSDYFAFVDDDGADVGAETCGFFLKGDEFLEEFVIVFGEGVVTFLDVVFCFSFVGEHGDEVRIMKYEFFRL